MSFVPSMTEPPPTASRKSTFRSFAQRNGFAQGLDGRVRLDAPELDQVAAFECGDDLIVDAVTLDTAPRRRSA